MKITRETIRQRRKELGLTLAGLGGFADPPIDAAAIFRVENGERGLSPGMALRLREAFTAAEAAKANNAA
jgi:transcriptional regulator with XRE-family HTH domain